MVIVCNGQIMIFTNYLIDISGGQTTIIMITMRLYLQMKLISSKKSLSDHSFPPIVNNIAASASAISPKFEKILRLNSELYKDLTINRKRLVHFF